jgi:menaquinone-dependent protoporphyrinogen oxidase
MSILVTYASTHNSTKEIAERIAERLKFDLPSVTIDVQPAETAPLPPAATEGGQKSAVVIGSAIHAQKWLSPTRAYLSKLAALPAAERPDVWAFSVGNPPTDKALADEEATMGRMVRGVLPDLRGHVLFKGRFETRDMNFIVRICMGLIPQTVFPRGDSRDWDAIAAWTDGVAKEMVERGIVAQQQPQQAEAENT